MPENAKRDICIILGSEGAVKFSPQISQMLDDEEGWDILEKQVDKVDSVREFLKSLDDSVGLYHAAKEVQDDSKATVVRDNFRAARKNLIRIKENLGMTERIFLGENATELEANFSKAYITLGLAVKLVQENVSPGAPSGIPRLLTAAHVALAMRRNLDIEPKTTKDGLFVQLLEIVLKAATGKEQKAIHELARQALKIEITDYSGGGIMFEVQNPI